MAVIPTNIDNVNHTYEQGGVKYGLDPKTNLYQEASKITPAVITSRPATNEYNTIQSQHQGIVSGIANQATANANAKVISDTQNATKEKAQSDIDLAKSKLAIDKATADAKMAAVTGATVEPSIPAIGQSVYNPLTGKMTTVDMIGKNGDGSYSVTFADTPNTQRVEASGIGELTKPQTKVSGTQNALQQAEADYQVQAKQVQDTISGITKGTIPLNEGQIAQVEELKRSFQQLIDQQKLINISSSGIANTRGYQAGAAEYDPTFATKTIGSIVTAGMNKIVDYNVKMASAVAQLTEGFKSDNIRAVKDAWNIYNQASEARTKSLQKVIDDSQKVIKEAQEAKERAETNFYNRVTKPIQDIQKDVLKNGGDANLAASIGKAANVEEAMALAGEFLQAGTGTIGEYMYYKRQEEAAGRTPLTYNAYQNMDANRKISIAKAGVQKSTENQRKGSTFSTINALLNTKNAQGVPYLDGNGFMTPVGFKQLVTAASEGDDQNEPVSRKSFLEQYGGLIYKDNYQAYGLTPKEAKDLGFTK